MADVGLLYMILGVNGVGGEPQPGLEMLALRGLRARTNSTRPLRLLLPTAKRAWRQTSSLFTRSPWRPLNPNRAPQRWLPHLKRLIIKLCQAGGRPLCWCAGAKGCVGQMKRSRSIIRLDRLAEPAGQSLDCISASNRSFRQQRLPETVEADGSDGRQFSPLAEAISSGRAGHVGRWRTGRRVNRRPSPGSMPPGYRCLRDGDGHQLTTRGTDTCRFCESANRPRGVDSSRQHRRGLLFTCTPAGRSIWIYAKQ
ncbi:unnamed protein product [Protopolystoma xenopodis]|uniref:Uncharacterized protein n=1 Tax=Protopolystoma xenopodis TaxID=117903 RepID=A0A448WT84_9PLAT|nr:unnamed protein product [Protopolystoma xenopodis]